jgi:hypothetical protein
MEERQINPAIRRKIFLNWNGWMLTRIMVIMETISSRHAKERRLVFGITQLF